MEPSVVAFAIAAAIASATVVEEAKALMRLVSALTANFASLMRTKETVKAEMWEWLFHWRKPS